MLYHCRVWPWLGCTSPAQWFELSCTGVLFCSVLHLVLLCCGTYIYFILLFSQFIGLDGIESLVEQLHRVTNVTFQTWRLLTPILMQVSFGILQGRITTGHIDQEALFTNLLCLCNWFWLSLTVYVLNLLVLCRFECFHSLDMLPEAASLWHSVWCFRSPGI